MTKTPVFSAVLTCHKFDDFFSGSLAGIIWVAIGDHFGGVDHFGGCTTSSRGTKPSRTFMNCLIISPFFLSAKNVTHKLLFYIVLEFNGVENAEFKRKLGCSGVPVFRCSGVPGFSRCRLQESYM